MPRIDLVLTDGFPLLSLSLVTEPLRVANRESLKQEFSWQFLSAEGGPMRSSSGVELETEPLEEDSSDVIVLLSSYHPETALRAGLLAWLRQQARRGRLMGCVDTAAMIFAEAGLLTRQPAAVHYEALPGYLEKYPGSLFVDRLCDFSPPLCSSAGGVATFDMTLALIGHYSGAALARRVAQILTYLPGEAAGAQRMLVSDKALPHTNRDLARAAGVMMSTLDAPLELEEISRQLQLPPWKLNRLFKRYLGQPPAAYYRGLRLSRARDLLRNSHHPVAQIAALCGFENPETFSRAYKRQYGVQPKADRGYGG
ncbi:MAG: helix-turn-helix domain-containing protein [Pseudomonadota bacterium]